MELILFAMISLIVIVAMLASRLNDNSFPFPFEKKSTVFTPAEKNFQNLVEEAIGEKYRVVNRVKLSDIITVRNGVSSKATQTATTKADNKYLDFAICDKDSMALLATIDLVDTQGKGYKMKKDWFVTGALEAASIPHLRIKVKAHYTVDEIRNCITPRLSGNKVPTQEPKIKGRVIPAPLIKARPRASNTGVITSSAAQASIPRQLPSQRTPVLPH